MEQVETGASSRTRSISYYPDTRTLEIEYRSGGRYAYYDFPQEEWDDFKNAPSPGNYIDSNIKGVYAFRRVG